MAENRQKATPGPSGCYEFEVLICKDGRWTIECLLDDEAEARAKAQLLIKGGSCEEAKVSRQRQGGSGFSSEILHLKASARKLNTFALAGDPGKAPPCETLEDLYRWETRRFLATLLRGYLQHHSLTPSELIFDWRHAKALIESGGLVHDAVQRVAGAQAERAGQPVVPRVKALDALVEKAARRAAEVQTASRKLMTGRSLEAATLPEIKGLKGLEARALSAACLSESIGRIGHLEGKLDALLTLLPRVQEPWFSCIEEMVAECLLFSEAISTLFAHIPDRMSLIQRLADLVEGRDTAAAIRTKPHLEALARLNKQGRAPHCAGVLEGWMAPLVRSREPLDKSQPNKEVRLIELLARRLRRPDGGWIGGESVAKAFEVRRARVREQALRGLGMDSAADALGRVAARGG